jgi:hypothetical protein
VSARADSIRAHVLPILRGGGRVLPPRVAAELGVKPALVVEVLRAVGAVHDPPFGWRMDSAASSGAPGEAPGSHPTPPPTPKPSRRRPSPEGRGSKPAEGASSPSRHDEVAYLTEQVRALQAANRDALKKIADLRLELNATHEAVREKVKMAMLILERERR